MAGRVGAHVGKFTAAAKAAGRSITAHVKANWQAGIPDFTPQDIGDAVAKVLGMDNAEEGPPSPRPRRPLPPPRPADFVEKYGWVPPPLDSASATPMDPNDEGSSWNWLVGVGVGVGLVFITVARCLRHDAAPRRVAVALPPGLRVVAPPSPPHPHLPTPLGPLLVVVGPRAAAAAAAAAPPCRGLLEVEVVTAAGPRYPLIHK